MGWKVGARRQAECNTPVKQNGCEEFLTSFTKGRGPVVRGMD